MNWRLESEIPVCACLALLVVLGGGCALTKDHIELGYVPRSNPAYVDGADNVRLVVAVRDGRSVRDRVSSKKNAHGIEMASIISDNDVAQLVSDAIANELRNRGFEVNGGDVTVEVELTRFYNDFKMGHWSGAAEAEVTCHVQVKGPGGSIEYANIITGSYTETGIQLTSGRNAKTALEGALEHNVTQLLQDDSFIQAILRAGIGTDEGVASWPGDSYTTEHLSNASLSEP